MPFDDWSSRNDTRARLPGDVSCRLSTIPGKDAEPIALNAGSPVRPLLQFFGQHACDRDMARDRLGRSTPTSRPGPISPNLSY
jgi:hypothetical protein